MGGDIFAEPLGSLAENGAHLVIGHGVNTQGLMGAGFAAQVEHRYPAVLHDYRNACRSGDLTPGHTWMVEVDGQGTLVANIASQRVIGRDARPDWLRRAIADLHTILGRQGNRYEVRLPLIGAGIGGLLPTQAADIIFETADEAPDTVNTVLYLRHEDKHTRAVVARHRWWYRLGVSE